MCVVGSEDLERRYAEGVLLRLVQQEGLEIALETHNIAIMRAYDLIYKLSTIPTCDASCTEAWSYDRTILSPATMKVLVASPFRYTGPRLLVRRLYLSFGSSSTSSSSSSSESCSTLSFPSLATFSRCNWSRAGVRGSSLVFSAAMLAA
jgi:hypothetical protein